MGRKLLAFLFVALILSGLKIMASCIPDEVSAVIASERLSQYVQNIGTFNRILPQEKVYLHFDNTA